MAQSKPSPIRHLVPATVATATATAVAIRSAARHLAGRTQRISAFERRRADGRPRILVTGDSTAVGTGASHPSRSVAGRLGADFPVAEIVNLSRNGWKLGEVAAALRQSPERGFDLAVLLAGANDVVEGTSLAQIERDLDRLLEVVADRAQRSLLVCQGNMGHLPGFPRVVRPYLTERSRHVRDIYRHRTAARQLGLVDLFIEGDPVPGWSERFFHIDQFHPSDEGYAEWYRRIRLALVDLGLVTA